MNKPSKKTSLLVWLSLAAAFLLLLYSDFVTAGHFEQNPFAAGETTGSEMPLPSDLRAVTEGLPEGFRGQLEQSLQAPAQEGYTPEETEIIKKYYSETAFVGDSLLVAFTYYLQKGDPEGYFTKSTILAAYSYSTRAALMSVSPKSIHPLYRGKKMQVWDSIKKAGKKRVFLIFWANEIPDASIEHANANLEKVVAKLRETNPGIEIYIFSPCYMYKDTTRTDKTDHINNPNLHALALSRREFCRTHGTGYIEVSKYIGNEKDGLYEKYTSDKFVHVNNDAYAIWKQVLTDFALGREPDIPTTP